MRFCSCAAAEQIVGVSSSRLAAGAALSSGRRRSSAAALEGAVREGALDLWLLFPSNVTFLFVWGTDCGNAVVSSRVSHLVLLLSCDSLRWRQEVVVALKSPGFLS